MNTDKTVMVIHETLLKGIVSNLLDIGMALGLIGIGVWLQSSAMQWVGAIIFFFALAHRAAKFGTYTTPQQAADELKAKFGVTAS